MSLVKLSIGGNEHEITCKDGDEEKIKRLAERVDKRVLKLRESFAATSDLMVMTVLSITMEDEIRALKSGGIEESSAEESDASEDTVNLAVARALEPVAESLERLASTLEKV